MDVVKGIRATKYYKNMVNTCQYTYKPQRAAQQSMCFHRAEQRTLKMDKLTREGHAGGGRETIIQFVVALWSRSSRMLFCTFAVKGLNRITNIMHCVHTS